MKTKIKETLKKQEWLVKLYRRMRSRPFFKIRYKKIIKGKGNSFEIDSSAIFEDCLFHVIGNDNKLIIHGSTFLKKVVFFIKGNNNLIQISENVKFIRSGTLWIEDENCEIRIGMHTSFEDVHIAVTEPGSKIIIGEDCMFAYDIDLRTGDSHSIIDTITKERINYASNIKIDNHVWIASHVSILKGAKIGANSVVATRSVVTKAFDQNGILIGGVPAKILRDNITWDRDRIYEH